MNIEEYKATPPEWKPKLFNFRGNAENWAYIQGFQFDHHLKSQGQALDFIVKWFESNYGKTAYKPENTPESNQESTAASASENGASDASERPIGSLRLVGWEKYEQDTNAYKARIAELEQQLAQANEQVEEYRDMKPVAHLGMVVSTILETARPDVQAVLKQEAGIVKPIGYDHLAGLLVAYMYSEPGAPLLDSPAAKIVLEEIKKIADEPATT